MTAGAERRGRFLRFAAIGAVLAMSAIGAPTPAAAEACANESLRVEQGALELPDCRAYELVTPGARIAQTHRPARAAVGGGAITYYTNHPAPGAETSSFFYLARRGTEGWSYRPVGPQNAASSRYESVCDQNLFFSSDLTSYVLEAGWFESSDSAKCKRTVEPIYPGEPVPYRNVFLHNPATDSYRLINLTPEGVAPANAAFQDASDDFGRIVFAEQAQLTPEAPPGHNFYIWSDGIVRLLTFLPDGTPVSGELVEATSRPGISSSGFAPIAGALSADGRRAFFYSGGRLYLRENADEPQSAISGGECSEPSRACTVEVDASQGPGPSGGGTFWRATQTASAAYFTADSKLTPDSTAEPGEPDLYRYDAASGILTDLTVHSGEPAAVQGVSGMSEGGSYLYFVANGALAPGASPGDCPGTWEDPGHCNLYVLHDGSIRFIARLSGREAEVWHQSISSPPSIHKAAWLGANVSPNGRYLAFMSYESLTGYDNTNVEYNTPVREVFLYDAMANGGAGDLVCVSCPQGPSQSFFQHLATAGNYGPTPYSSAKWMTRSVLDDGSVFFETMEGLLPTDTDGHEDVYQHRNGELYLISRGDVPAPSSFLEASADGSDVFFRTADALVRGDTDNENISLYDARVGGGFPEPAAPARCESEETCRERIEPPPALVFPSAFEPQQTRRPSCRRKKHRRGCRAGGHKKRRARHGKRRARHGKRRARHGKRRGRRPRSREASS